MYEEFLLLASAILLGTVLYLFYQLSDNPIRRRIDKWLEDKE